MKTKNDVLLEQYVHELRNDPVLAAKEILGVDLAPHERVTLRGMWTSSWNMLVWGRGTGKTFMDGVYSALCAVLNPGDKIVITGPGFRQAQLVFKEVERLVSISPLFADSVQGVPKHNTADWTMEFKNGSSILALPLGTDGGKIRGVRANRLIIDEVVQVPPEIIDKVLIPFMATSKNPMAKYLGIDDEEQDNTLIYSTSAYYQFNHAYERYLTFIEERYGKGNLDYFVTQFNWKDTPEGFVNMKVLEMAKKQSTDADFRTEYMAEWVSDTAGFYSASLIESCKSLGFLPELRGKAGEEYVLGVDPAEIYNSCGFTVIKLGNPYQIVQVDAVDDIRYPEICSRIMDYMSKFNIVRIGLDRGAGMPVLDLFREGRPFFNPATSALETTRLLELDDTSGLDGKRIIETIAAQSQSVNEINFGMKASMESGLIKWPALGGDSPDFLQERDIIMDNIRAMEGEYRMIEAKPTKQGLLSFSVPSHKNKDRYSSSLFALAAAKSYMGEGKKQLELPTGCWSSRRDPMDYY